MNCLQRCSHKVRFCAIILAVFCAICFFIPYLHTEQHGIYSRSECGSTTNCDRHTCDLPPIAEILNLTIKLPFDVSTRTHKHIVLRAAYLDMRNDTSTTVILAHMEKAVVNKGLVVACVVDEQLTTSFKLHSLTMNEWIHRYHPHCTHDNVLVFCYNTWHRNNSRVSLIYQSPNNKSEYYEAESENDLLYYTTETWSKKGVFVCTTVYGSPPYFIEWLRYQKTLGVDLVYLQAQESFTRSNAFNNTFFQHMLETGLVQLKVWKAYLNQHEIFYNSQGLFYNDCIYRFQGVYDYVMMVDTDDFLIPMGLNLHYNMSEIFSFLPDLGSVRLHWLRYYEPEGGMNLTESMDGNLTQYVNQSSATWERNVKSIHKLSAVIEANVHDAAQLYSGYKAATVPESLAYMAHIKNV